MCDKWWLESLGGERREIRSLNELEKFFGTMRSVWDTFEEISIYVSCY